MIEIEESSMEEGDSSSDEDEEGSVGDYKDVDFVLINIADIFFLVI